MIYKQREINRLLISQQDSHRCVCVSNDRLGNQVVNVETCSGSYTGPEPIIIIDHLHWISTRK